MDRTRRSLPFHSDSIFSLPLICPLLCHTLFLLSLSLTRTDCFEPPRLFVFPIKQSVRGFFRFLHHQVHSVFAV